MLPENTILQGRYQILEPIGRGGMGAVYKALDLRLRAIVALKETLLTGEVVRRAFEREAQLLAGLRHPALPKVSDHFTEGEGQFLVMEFIQGADLGRLMAQREGPFPVADVLRWADSLLDALEYLHSHNPPIVHRDIKPQNMKLTERGEIILLDFGLAKGAAAQATRAMTTSSIFGYTPHYAPLEQIQGTGTDPRSDLYALAATLHHLLTGTPPPDALTRAAAKINEAADPLELASRLNPDVPEGVAMVLARAMAQKPDQRYPTAAAMKSALRIAAQGGKPTETLSEVTGKLPDPNATMVIVGAGETVAARGGAGAGATTVEANIGTTVTPAGRPASAAPSAPRRRAWLWPAIGGAAVGIVAIVALLSGIGGGGAAPTSVPTAPPPTSVPAAAVSTEAPTDTPAPTAAPLTNEQILQTAVVLQTAEADKRAAELAT
ncbi:MAG TPA: protein kinase, partial [Roseiflexaceae bacterium]|nr:protein kinase [Roseiflexaceae bacterium]